MREKLLAVFSHRTLAVLRWDLRLFGARVRGLVRGQAKLLRRRAEIAPRPLYLNLGAGPRGLASPHYINVDAVEGPNVHGLLDLSRPLPFADETFDGVFCEHVLEHFTFEDAQAVVREVRRVLRPGAWFRIVVPDGEMVVRRYLEAPDELVRQRAAGDETPMSTVNGFFRQRYEHQFMYDWPTAAQLLQRAGYSRVSRASYRQSAGPTALVIDDATYEWESLYVDAEK